MSLDSLNDAEKSTYFAAAAKLNETAMFEYGLKRGDRKSSGTQGYKGDHSFD